MTTNRATQGARAGGSTASRGFDWWLLAVVAAALLPLLKAWGGPLGEPVADDFDFLRRALLERGSFLDSGGAVIYWRPLARQIYYDLVGPVMLSSPLVVALLHAVLLAVAGVLLYRAFRPAWGGPRAAAIACFPVIADSARVLLTWPAAFQDLGALVLASLALHERSRDRLSNALAALLGALLCKEIAIVAALLLPWMPGGAPGSRKRWIVGVVAVAIAWGAAYAYVMRSAGVLFQGHLEGERPAFVVRWLWAIGSIVSDGFSLSRVSPAITLPVAAIAIGTLAAIGAVGGTRSPHLRWIGWGVAWVLLCAAILGETFPVWGPFRSSVALVGLGVSVVGAATMLPPLWTGLLVGARVALLLLASGPPARVTLAPPGDGSGFDYATIARLQLHARDTREALAAGARRLRPRSEVVWVHRPLMTERAFAHSKALHVWYRDTTLHWSQWKDVIEAGPGRSIGAGIEFEAEGDRPIVLVDPAAMSQVSVAADRMRADDFPAALAALGRADSLQRDRGAKVFLGAVGGKRALSLMSLDDGEGARREAQRSLALWRNGSDARYVLAVSLASEGRFPEALAELDTVLSLYPFDPSARMLRDTLRAAAAGR